MEKGLLGDKKDSLETFVRRSNLRAAQIAR